MYHFLKKSFVVFFLFYLWAGVFAQKGMKNQIQFPIQKNLTSTRLSIPPKIYAHLSSIVIYKDLLISIEPMIDTIFSVFQLPECNYIGSIGINGRGPNEFLRPDARNAVVTETGLRFFDQLDRLIDMDLTDFKKTKNFKYRITRLPGEMAVLSGGFQINDSIICGKPYIGGKENTPFIRFNTKSKKVDYFGEWPSIYPKDKEDLYWIIYSGRIRIKPDRTRFVMIMHDIRMFQIYSSCGQLVKEIILETQDNYFNGAEIKPYPVMYYTCVRANDEYFYILNQACRGPQMPTNIPRLEVWDWKGNPIANFQLDRPVSQFDITSDGKEMYCIDWETMNIIFKYDLSGITN